MPGSHLGLKEAFVARRDSFRRTRGEATCGEILLHEGILLVPTFAEPLVKFIRVVERNIGNTEAAPVKVDRFRRLATEICAKECEEILTELASPILVLVAFVLLKREKKRSKCRLTVSPRRQLCSHIHSQPSP